MVAIILMLLTVLANVRPFRKVFFCFVLFLRVLFFFS